MVRSAPLEFSQLEAYDMARETLHDEIQISHANSACTKEPRLPQCLVLLGSESLLD